MVNIFGWNLSWVKFSKDGVFYGWNFPTAEFPRAEFSWVEFSWAEFSWVEFSGHDISYDWSLMSNRVYVTSRIDTVAERCKGSMSNRAYVTSRIDTVAERVTCLRQAMKFVLIKLLFL